MTNYDKERERMTIKCPTCGSESIIDGKLSTGLGGLLFVTKKSQKKLPFTKNYSTLTAKGCRDCGAVFDIRMDNPCAIDKDR